jgi:hypothetical protein
MALRTDFDVQFLVEGGTRVEAVAAAADHFDLVVLGMYAGFHGPTPGCCQSARKKEPRIIAAGHAPHKVAACPAGRAGPTFRRRRMLRRRKLLRFYFNFTGASLIPNIVSGIIHKTCG